MQSAATSPHSPEPIVCAQQRGEMYAHKNISFEKMKRPGHSSAHSGMRKCLRSSGQQFFEYAVLSVEADLLAAFDLYDPSILDNDMDRSILDTLDVGKDRLQLFLADSFRLTFFHNTLLFSSRQQKSGGTSLHPRQAAFHANRPQPVCQMALAEKQPCSNIHMQHIQQHIIHIFSMTISPFQALNL